MRLHRQYPPWLSCSKKAFRKKSRRSQATMKLLSAKYIMVKIIKQLELIKFDGASDYALSDQNHQGNTLCW